MRRANSSLTVITSEGRFNFMITSKNRSINKLVEYSTNAIMIRDNFITVIKNKSSLSNRKLISSLVSSDFIISRKVTVIDYDNKEILFEYSPTNKFDELVEDLVRDDWLITDEIKYVYRWFSRVISCTKHKFRRKIHVRRNSI